MFESLFGGRKVRSNKGKKRQPYGPRTGKTRSGKRFRAPVGQKTVAKTVAKNAGNNVLESIINANKVVNNANKSNGNANRPNGNANRPNVLPVKKTRKTRSNKGKKRGPYGPRTGKTRSGKKFRG